MENQIKLNPKQVPANLKHLDNYNGRKFKAVITDQVMIPIDAGLWSGGTRDYYLMYYEPTKQASPVLGQNSFYEGRKEKQIDLTPNWIIVRHSHFMGKDSGLTFFIHPDNQWAKDIEWCEKAKGIQWA